MAGNVLDSLKNALPAGGLFTGMEWRFSPEPYPLTKKMVKRLETLGRRLLLFQRACDEIYRRSHKGSLPAWIRDYLDAGKPDSLLKAAHARPNKDALARIIRPDLLVLPDEQLALTEIDSVPGGIGLTAWLGKTYHDLDEAWEIVGSPTGMVDGFGSLFPSGADIVVSKESSDYRPEMEWIAGQLGDGFRVADAENYAPSDRDAYRFFELFDLPNIPPSSKFVDAYRNGDFSITPPMKPWLEEKMWLALFWSGPLRAIWERSLRGAHRKALEDLIPYGWVIDPSPIPHHAALPRLDVQNWDDVGGFSQALRQLVLKRSGFAEDAWGSRSVSVGHDLPQQEWAAAMQRALASYPEAPFVMQEFRNAAIIDHPYFDEEGAVQTMNGRVRLCPYYFVEADGVTVNLGGVLATVTPSDKKVIHGMRDAVMVPCRIDHRS
jgi:hypothetical protein